jgi:hypothetical protein
LGRNENQFGVQVPRLQGYATSIVGATQNPQVANRYGG